MAIQRDVLLAEGVEDHRIFGDTQTGQNLDREGIETLRMKVEKGDIVIVTRLDRLGRDLLDMITLVKEFTEQGIFVRFIEDGVSTEGPAGELTVHLLAVVAQSERRRIKERTREGQQAASKKGIHCGRGFAVDINLVKERVEQDVTVIAMAAEFNVSRVTIYKAIKAMKISVEAKELEAEGLKIVDIADRLKVKRNIAHHALTLK